MYENSTFYVGSHACFLSTQILDRLLPSDRRRGAHTKSISYYQDPAAATETNASFLANIHTLSFENLGFQVSQVRNGFTNSTGFRYSDSLIILLYLH
jgi:hypothetical protein